MCIISTSIYVYAHIYTFQFAAVLAVSLTDAINSDTVCMVSSACRIAPAVPGIHASTMECLAVCT